MKTTFFFMIAVLTCLETYSQVKPAVPDINKLRKMSPAQLEAYKQQLVKQYSAQAKQVAQQANFKLDDMTLPDYKVQLPSKDIKRLSLLPTQPPTLLQLSEMLANTKRQIQTATTPAVLQEVKTIANGQNADALQQAAIGEFYADRPEQSVLLAISVWQKLF